MMSCKTNSDGLRRYNSVHVFIFSSCYHGGGDTAGVDRRLREDLGCGFLGASGAV